MLNQDHLNHINHNKNIWNSISEIQNICGLIDYDIAEILDISTQDLKTRKFHNSDLSTFEVLKIAQKFQLDIYHLYNNDFDHKLVEDRFNGVQSTLGKKYSENPFSKKRTQMNILSYIEENYFTLLDSCYKRFQLNESCFTNQDESINIKFLEDLCNYLSQRGLTNQDFYKMGLHSFEINKETNLAKTLSDFRNIPELFSFIVDEFSHKYDVNFNYQILESQNRTLIIKETPTSLALDSNKGNIGNIYTTAVKSGVFASFPKYIRQSESDVSIIKSIYNGDSETLYELNY